MVFIFHGNCIVMNKQTCSQVEEDGIEFKSITMEKFADLQKVKEEMGRNRILIVNMTPILRKSIEQREYTLREIHSYTTSQGFALARMGQGRLLILPPYVRF